MSTAIVREATDFRVTDQTRPVKLLLEKLNDDELPPFELSTVPDILNRTAANHPDHPAMKFKDQVTKEWRAVTFKQYRDRVEKMTKVFIKLGLEKHGTVAILAFNCVEWFVSELSAIYAGGIVTGIYTTNSSEACQHILESSKANIVVVDDDLQMEKIHKIKDNLPHLKAVIQINAPYAQYVKKNDGYWRWSELEEMETDEFEDEYQSRLSDIAVNECCLLVYTSGTVGNPKGVMLSHDSILWCTHVALHSFGQLVIAEESVVSYMPLSHVAGQILDIFGCCMAAGTVYFADKNALKGTLFDTIKEVQPTLFFTVPRLFEKIQEKMLAIGAQSGFVKKTIGGWAKRVTLQHHLDRINGTPTNTLQYRIATKFLLSKVKEALGFQRCRTFFTGAAPLNPETKKYFMSLDMFICEGYGMSESAVHTHTSNATPSFETVGKSLPGTLTKVINVDDEGHGEICIKGRHVFMGYVNEPEKTFEAIDDDRWVHTGDVGYIDDRGLVYVTGRIKEIIITSGGENIPYLNIENLLKQECSAVSNAFLIGDKRKFLSMLITLKTELNEDGSPKDDLAPETIAWFETFDIDSKNLSELIANEAVKKALQDAIDRVNKKSISNAQKVQKFAILPSDFTVATGDLTPTMKLKRNVVLNKYKDLIESFYV